MVGREEVGGSAEARNMGGGKRKSLLWIGSCSRKDVLGWESDFGVKVWVGSSLLFFSAVANYVSACS